MSVRRPHGEGCPKGLRALEHDISRYAEDPPCTCGETERRRLAKEASGLSGRAFRRSEGYEHGDRPGMLADYRAGQDVALYRTNPSIVLVSLPKALVKDLVDARAACEECPDTNAGDTQRANLNEQRAMKAVCELVRRSYRP